MDVNGITMKNRRGLLLWQMILIIIAIVIIVFLSFHLVPAQRQPTTLPTTVQT